MKVILIHERGGGDTELTLIDTDELELVKEIEDSEIIGFVPKAIISTILTVDVKSMKVIKLTRKRNVMKYIQKLFRRK